MPRIAVGATSVIGSVALYELLSRSLGSQEFAPVVDVGAWDAAWDRGAMASSSEESGNAVAQLRSGADAQVARRHVVFVRHAQPAGHGGGKAARNSELTATGTKQAELTGQRLKQVFDEVSAVYHSGSKEAKATAEVIHRVLVEGVSKDQAPVLVESQLLAEGIPTRPSPAPAALGDVSEAELKADGVRAEEAFRALIWRPQGKGEEQQGLATVEVVVGHGNVIRYLLCRALQCPSSGWSRLAANHCTISWLDIGCDGIVALREFGGSGHLPPDLITYY